jgi:hypothetical protein
VIYPKYLTFFGRGGAKSRVLRTLLCGFVVSPNPTKGPLNPPLDCKISPSSTTKLLYPYLFRYGGTIFGAAMGGLVGLGVLITIVVCVCVYTTQKSTNIQSHVVRTDGGTSVAYIPKYSRYSYGADLTLSSEEICDQMFPFPTPRSITGNNPA